MGGIIVGLVFGLLGAVVLVGAVLLVICCAVMVCVYRVCRTRLDQHRERVAERAHRRAETAARAELQHRWYVAGDPRGTYGRYPPIALP